MKKHIRRISGAAIAMAMAATLAIPAAAETPDDLYLTDGNSTGYGGGFGVEIGYDRAYQEAVKVKAPTESHMVSYYLRTGDSGGLEFDWARVDGRTLGGEHVPGVSLPEGWYLDGYYVGGRKYTAGELAGYVLSTPTLEVEIRTYPSGVNSGVDDRTETYTVTYRIRSGNKGDLVFERTTVKGKGNTIPYADIPTLTSRFAANYSISGYYVDGVKYSRSELAKLPVTGDLDIEVRTYHDTGNEQTGWDEEDGEYDWSRDLGNGYGVQPSVYGGLYIDGYYYPPGTYAWPSAYPCTGAYTGVYAAPYVSPFEQCTVTFDPQSEHQCLITQVWKGGQLVRPENPRCSGYTFLGWSTSKDARTGYWQFDKDTVNQNLVLYGIWKKNTPSKQNTVDTSKVIRSNMEGYCAVALQPNNGASYSPVLVKQGNNLRISGVPQREGYRFVGWSKDPFGSNLWNFNRDTVSCDLTLYGIWKKA